MPFLLGLDTYPQYNKQWNCIEKPTDSIFVHLVSSIEEVCVKKKEKKKRLHVLEGCVFVCSEQNPKLLTVLDGDCKQRVSVSESLYQITVFPDQLREHGNHYKIE